MPSLATRRRRQDASASTSTDRLEGGGHIGRFDDEQDTQAKMKVFRKQQAQRDQMSLRAHLLSFPIFLFGLLALFSHSLHLSFLSCILVPLILGAVLFLLVSAAQSWMGPEKAAEMMANHGTPFIFLLMFFTLVGLALSQLLLRDKFGPSLL